MPQPEPEPVNVVQVEPLAFGARRFYFDKPFAVEPTVLDPAFEVSVDGIVWTTPTGFAYIGPLSIVHNYAAPFWGSLFWRVNSTPTNFSWTPDVFTPPQSGGIPFP